ncbi:MAG: ATP-grasp domain-containing protein [Deltaproteobacteria bacterium]|nr:ATP-grasp domain-containing protein [Deltaproteobacteria bacterium]
MKLALTYNLRKEETETSDVDAASSEDLYAEWDDMETITAVADALGEVHGEVALVEADEDAYEKLRALRPELVFNMAEGLHGESREGHIPSMLEMLKIPYTGSNPLTLALTLNKARAKQILLHDEVATPKYIVIEDVGEEVKGLSKLSYPMMVKPLFEGSSKGIRNDSIVNNLEELQAKADFIIKEYKEPAIVEEYLEGREFTVAVLGNGEEARALPIVEIDYSALPPDVNPIYSYEAKWIFDRPEDPLDIFKCPAELDEELKRGIEDVTLDAYRALNVRDWCRVDVRLDGAGRANIIELNPLPGILPRPEQNSCFPKAARADGMDFSELVNNVIDIARKRYGI